MPTTERENKHFHCPCEGPVKVISETLIEHACKNKYAPGTSYYDGVDCFIQYKRVATRGVTYTWWVVYED